ncbi:MULTISPECIES: hypothetical protein [Providencia]|uniref:hypothetical protein n=1 Tax=Providencia TaxID=586 RepID=UPI000E042971|nr:hypothetical protein [Providencia stuartii]SUC41814.1 Uncharacterised protein [Providencia stuartii]
MLPINIKNLAIHLLDETKHNNLKWSYDSYKSRISASYKEMYITLTYYFDYESEVASYVFDLYMHGKPYIFKENMFGSDYSLLSILYEQGMASELGDFNF